MVSVTALRHQYRHPGQHRKGPQDIPRVQTNHPRPRSTCWEKGKPDPSLRNTKTGATPIHRPQHHVVRSTPTVVHRYHRTLTHRSYQETSGQHKQSWLLFADLLPSWSWWKTSPLWPRNSNSYHSQHWYTPVPPDTSIPPNSQTWLDIRYLWRKRWQHGLEVRAPPSCTNLWATSASDGLLHHCSWNPSTTTPLPSHKHSPLRQLHST